MFIDMSSLILNRGRGEPAGNVTKAAEAYHGELRAISCVELSDGVGEIRPQSGA